MSGPRTYSPEFEAQAVALAQKIGAPAASSQLGVSVAHLRRWCRAAGVRPKGVASGPQPIAEPVAPGESSERTESGDTLDLRVETPRKVKTLADLIAVCEIDTDEWAVVSFTSAAYQGQIKTPEGEPRVTQMFSVRARCQRRVQEIAAREALAEVVAEATSRVARCPLVLVTPPKSGYLLGLSIADAHHGRLCWGLETGSADYDLKIAVAAQEHAFETLLARSAHVPVEKILMVLGNDGLHVDSPANTTTRGTPQDVDGRHFRTFGVTWRTYVDQIERARRIAPVLVVVMPGNHDQVSMLHIGEVLTAWFRNDPQVEIDNRPLRRKYVEWGANLIGVQHGDRGKPTQWSQLMPVEAPAAWARSRHRSILTGHLHLERMEQDEVNGVKVWRVPSLAPPDYWHATEGYVTSRQAALAFHFHAEEGLVGTASYTAPAALKAA